MLTAVLAGCQTGGVRGAPPRACGLAEFGEAQGLPLPPTAKEAARKRSKKKGEPLAVADGIPVNGGVGDIGKWVDAGGGWKAWRLWLRSEEARSMSLHLRPVSLPPGAELWLCSPDGTARQGPYREKGPGQTGQLYSAAVVGPEIWVEVLAPADRTHEVALTIATAFAAFR